MTLLDSLPHTGDLSRESFVRDSLGATLPTAHGVTADIRCWIQSANASEILEFQKIDQKITHKVLLNASPSTWRVGDIFTPDSGTFSGTSMRVRDQERNTRAQRLH